MVQARHVRCIFSVPNEEKLDMFEMADDFPSFASALTSAVASRRGTDVCVCEADGLFQSRVQVMYEVLESVQQDSSPSTHGVTCSVPSAAAVSSVPAPSADLAWRRVTFDALFDARCASTAADPSSLCVDDELAAAEEAADIAEAAADAAAAAEDASEDYSSGDEVLLHLRVFRGRS